MIWYSLAANCSITQTQAEITQEGPSGIYINFFPYQAIYRIKKVGKFFSVK